MEKVWRRIHIPWYKARMYMRGTLEHNNFPLAMFHDLPWGEVLNNDISTNRTFCLKFLFISCFYSPHIRVNNILLIRWSCNCSRAQFCCGFSISCFSILTSFLWGHKLKNSIAERTQNTTNTGKPRNPCGNQKTMPQCISITCAQPLKTRTRRVRLTRRDVSSDLQPAILIINIPNTCSVLMKIVMRH